MKIDRHNLIAVGGASGMALATVDLLVEKGAKVAILDLPEFKRRSGCQTIQGQLPSRNVMDYEGTQAALNAAIDVLGSVLCGEYRRGRHRPPYHFPGGSASAGRVSTDHRSEPDLFLQHRPAAPIA